MTDYERKIRTYFNLKLEGKICEKCWERFVNNYKIDNLLKLNAKAQTNLGTDSTKENQQLALDTARYVKEKIMKIDKEKANTIFPEITL